MNKLLIAMLTIVVLDAQVRAQGKKQPPAQSVLAELEPGQLAQFKTISNGDFRLLTAGEMKEYLTWAGQCFKDFDNNMRLPTQQLAASQSAGEPGAVNSFVQKYFGVNVNYLKSDYVDPHVGKLDLGRQYKVSQEKAMENKKNCLEDAKQYRETIDFYHRVMNIKVESSEPMLNPRDPLVARGFDQKKLEQDESDGGKKLEKLIRHYGKRRKYNERQAAELARGS